MVGIFCIYEWDNDIDDPYALFTLFFSIFFSFGCIAIITIYYFATYFKV